MTNRATRRKQGDHDPVERSFKDMSTGQVEDKVREITTDLLELFSNFGAVIAMNVLLNLPANYISIAGKDETAIESYIANLRTVYAQIRQAKKGIVN